MNKGELQKLYCKWCPFDCEELTEEEMAGCLASGGFADDFLSLLPEKPVLKKKHTFKPETDYEFGWYDGLFDQLRADQAEIDRWFKEMKGEA